MLFNKNDKITQKYDVVIIGGGLGGMTAANKLAKNGRKVLLLESHDKLGGFATWFHRRKHIFDVSLHGFPVGMIKTCRKYWSKAIADKIIQLKRVRFINPLYNIETDFTVEDFTSKLINDFKVSKEQVDNFFNLIMNMNYYDNKEMTNGELLESFFPGRKDVHRFLIEPIVYANGSTLEDPAITYGIVFSNFMSKGVYTFQGGTDLVIEMMQEELLKNNVDIRLKSKVDRIVVNNNVCQGVMVDGEVVASKSVLSNGNLIGTIFNLVGEEKFKPAFIEKVKKVRLNTSSCQVYMGIRAGETIEDIGDLIFYSEAKEFKTDELLSMNTTSRTFSLYYPRLRPQLADAGYTIVASTNARFEDWMNLSKEEYKAKKQELIEATLVSLEKVIPGVTKKIDYIEAATPLTIKRYTHHEKGASFGTKHEGLEISMGLDKEIQGLFHTGSVGIIMSGWLGAANYGVIQSYEVDNYLEKLG
ncbi:MAG TPA: FAD-dependent oxidoreductase [Smithella sp.]|nr:FAD-dependent oxidoreductase [Smithella sp.]MDM7988429.1 FAD-dependent oxidoreductase [Smithella sp.]HNY50347.1 FAD-dependent oxidoreductase [Smithella sp.]HOG90763.1 FAD-dependent oxidoreductase [Smithella sp.]HOU51096.1 FAD-dependent oxidoreductase [Smithella sp.]